MSVANDVLSYLRQFYLFREVMSTYLEYQSWLEEIHFSRRLETFLGDSKE